MVVVEAVHSELREGLDSQGTSKQGRSTWCLSRCAEQSTALGLCLYSVQWASGHHGVLGSCFTISSDVPGFELSNAALGCSGVPH